MRYTPVVRVKAGGTGGFSYRGSCVRVSVHQFVKLGIDSCNHVEAGGPKASTIQI